VGTGLGAGFGRSVRAGAQSGRVWHRILSRFAFFLPTQNTKIRDFDTWNNHERWKNCTTTASIFLHPTSFNLEPISSEANRSDEIDQPGCRCFSLNKKFEKHSKKIKNI
jgi:hypothetical protein